MGFYVTKADGSRQLFDRRKVMNTCMKMHASREAAEDVADKIEKQAYDGIDTHKILKMIFQYVKEYRPEVAFRLDLRQSISMLRPKPDFELFIAAVLEAEGYDVKSNAIVPGRCIEHEIDAVATKGRDVICVEVKHHYQHHTYTGLGVFLEAWASFEDLQAGHAANKNAIGFNGLLVACNTKVSDSAERYARCKGFSYLAWKSPRERSLERIIEEHKLYPVTLLKGIDEYAAARLGDAGIFLLKQLVCQDAKKIARILNMPRNKTQLLISRANRLLS